MILAILTHLLAIVLGAVALLVLLVALADDEERQAQQEYLENTDRRMRR